MLYPKSRMRFTKTYLGKVTEEGWIVLDLAGVDLDGVSKIYLPMEDIEMLKKRGDTASDRLKQARSLLGGDAEEESE